MNKERNIKLTEIEIEGSDTFEYVQEFHGEYEEEDGHTKEEIIQGIKYYYNEYLPQYNKDELIFFCSTKELMLNECESEQRIGIKNIMLKTRDRKIKMIKKDVHNG